MDFAGLAFVVLGASLFFSTAFADPYSLPKLLPVSLGVLMMCSSRWRRPAQMNPIGIAAGLFLVSAFVSTLGSIDVPLSLAGPHQAQFFGLMPLVLYALAFYGVASSDMDPVGLVILSGAPVAFYAVLQRAVPLPWWAANSIQGGRAGSSLGGAVYLGAYLSLVLPLAWAHRRFIVAALCAFGIAASGSRGAILAAAAGVMLYELSSARPRAQKMVLILAAAILCGGWMAVKAKAKSQGDAMRVQIWREAVIAFKYSPFIGTGPDTFALDSRRFQTKEYGAAARNGFMISESAHNDFLQVLATQGALGFLAYLILLAFVFAIAAMKDRAILAALFAVFVQAKVNPVPFAVLVVCAVLVGSLCQTEGEQTFWPRRAVFAPAFVAAFILITVGRMAMAEHEAKVAMVAQAQGDGDAFVLHFNRAAGLNPYDFWFTDQQLRAVWSAIPYVRNPLEGTKLARHVAELSVRLHPNDPAAVEWNAVTLEGITALGGENNLRQASGILDRAHDLAPTFEPIQARREVLKTYLVKGT